MVASALMHAKPSWAKAIIASNFWGDQAKKVEFLLAKKSGQVKT